MSYCSVLFTNHPSGNTRCFTARTSTGNQTDFRSSRCEPIGSTSMFVSRKQQCVPCEPTTIHILAEQPLIVPHHPSCLDRVAPRVLVRKTMNSSTD